MSHSLSPIATEEDMELILQDPKPKKTFRQYDEDVLPPLKALTNP